MTQLIAGLSEIADRYDVLLCDVWGVIHNGRESFPDACAALTRWRRERGPVMLISNSPRPSADVIPQLDHLGVPRQAWSGLVTSGDATRAMLADHAPGPAWRIGPDRDDTLYEGLGLKFAGPEEAAFISCTGPYNDDIETPEDYRADLTLAVERDLVMVCANPDKVVQRGDKLIYCGGALADLYKELGGTVLMAGKPYAPVYDLTLVKAGDILNRPADAKRVLALGDGVATDVQGANAYGLDVLFVAGGIHALDMVSPDAAKIEAFLAAHGAGAQFAMSALSW